MTQIKLPLVDWEKIRFVHLQAENERLRKKIDFLNHSRASYIGKFKNKK
jgi:hypothetical protein